MSKSRYSCDFHKFFDRRFRSRTSSNSLSLSELTLEDSSFLVFFNIPIDLSRFCSRIVSMFSNKSILKSSAGSSLISLFRLFSSLTFKLLLNPDPQGFSPPPFFHDKSSDFFNRSSVSRHLLRNLIARDNSTLQLLQINAGAQSSII